MMALSFTPGESLGLFKEYYPLDYKQRLLPAIDLIQVTAASKKTTKEVAAKICIASTTDIELKTRIQAGYALIYKNKNMANNLIEQVQDDLSKYKKQLHGLVEAIMSESDRIQLEKYYRGKIDELSQREKELIENIEVDATVISADQTDQKSEGESGASKSEG